MGRALVRVGGQDFYLPTPSLQRRGLPWEPTMSFQEPIRIPQEPEFAFGPAVARGHGHPLGGAAPRQPLCLVARDSHGDS